MTMDAAWSTRRRDSGTSGILRTFDRFLRACRGRADVFVVGFAAAVCVDHEVAEEVRRIRRDSLLKEMRMMGSMRSMGFRGLIQLMVT